MKKYLIPAITSIICIGLCLTMLGCGGLSYNFGSILNEDESYTIDIMYAERDLDYGDWKAPTRYDLKTIYEEQGYEVSIYEEEIPLSESDSEDNEPTEPEEPRTNSYLELKYTVDNIDELCMKEPRETKFDVGELLSGNLQEILEKGIFDCEKTDHSRVYNANFQYDLKFLAINADKPTWIRYEDALREQDERKAREENGETDDSADDIEIDLREAAKDSEFMYVIKIEKGNIIKENATEKDENEKIYQWKLTADTIDEINYSLEILNDVIVTYKEKEIELMTSSVNQGDIVKFKVKNVDKLKDIVILDAKNTRIEFRKVENSDDEFYFIMPTSDVKINIEYRILNSGTFSSISIIINLIIVSAIAILLIITKQKQINGGSNE